MKYTNYRLTPKQRSRIEFEKKFREEQRVREARNKIHKENDSALERFNIQVVPYMPYILSIIWIVAIVSAIGIVGSINNFAELISTQKCLLVFSVTNIIMFATSLYATKITSSKIDESNFSMSRYRQQLMNSLVDYIYDKDNEMTIQFDANKKELESDYKQKLEKLEFEFKMKADGLSSEYKSKESQLNKESKLIKEKCYQEGLKFNGERERFERIINSQYPFCALSELKSEALALIFDNSKDYLRYKQRPALKAAEEVCLMKNIAKDAERRCAEMKYKYEFLINLFPELKDYVADDRDLLKLSDAEDYRDFEENVDNVKAYLSEEEWNNLSTVDKNQLALDRWWERSEKTNREIGLLYEMYISHELRTNGFEVIEYGTYMVLKILEETLSARRMGKLILSSVKTGVKIRLYMKMLCANYMEQRLNTN